MGLQKRNAKGRLDKWYKLAKEKGYRARAAFKLIQLNRKYGFLERSKVLLDLCAAPGSWCQVAAETMPVDSIIVGVDLVPIKPISKVITFQGDITTDKCRATIRQHLKTWKADTVLHDGAPNVGTAWAQDSFNQAELALQSLKLATEFLIKDGTFVTKVFRSKDYNPLLWVFKQLFTKVEATKPPSSRNVSAEIFVVCRGFKAPKRIDPRFLDPRSVFADIVVPSSQNNEAKVYNPETKKRKRDGYDEGDYMQYKELPASEFVKSADPISVLANYNRLTFTQASAGDVSLAVLDKLPETTSDIRIYCQDLKVLGRKEFKAILKWRLFARNLFGLNTTESSRPLAEEIAEEVAQVEPMDEEMELQQGLQAIRDREKSKNKRERRRENERKQKEIVRMQLNMTTSGEIVDDQAGHTSEGGMFSLKLVDQKALVGKIARGNMVTLTAAEANNNVEFSIGSPAPFAEDDEGNDLDDGNDLERELDHMYDRYRERKAGKKAKDRAKMAREEHGDAEWEGFSASDQVESDDGVDMEEESTDEDEYEELGSRAMTYLNASESKPGKDGLSREASRFFEAEIFQDIPDLEAADDDDEGAQESRDNILRSDEVIEQSLVSASEVASGMNEMVGGEEVNGVTDAVHEPEGAGNHVGNDIGSDVDDDDWEMERRRRSEARVDIDVVTAEAMTLAHQLATGEKTRHEAVDDGFNKYSFRDRDGLPDWFLEDETKHSKLIRPVTKAAALAIKEKLRALNARPIKKVLEAKARKKYRMARKLEKLKKKSELLATDEGMTEKEKADSISKMLRRAAQKPRKQAAKLVVARGINRGVKGRPRGVPKGHRYKLVDPRMKKELRAQKRSAQKRK